jgi:hypothetical protein
VRRSLRAELDRDRLAAVTAMVAPGVPVTNITTIDTSTR